jgi:toxin CptA
LKVVLRSSKRLFIAIIFAHIFIAASLLPLRIPPWIKIAAVSALVGSAAFYIRRDALLAAANSIVYAEVEGGRTCMIELRSGASLPCVLLDTSFVSPYLTVLNLRLERAWFARHVVILPDSLDKDDFRRLRVWLRWKCAAASINGQPGRADGRAP